MSTKFYNGIILNFTDFWKNTHEIRKTLEQVFKKANIKLSCDKIVDTYVEKAVLQFNNPENIIEHGIYFESLRAFQKSTPSFATHPLRASVHIFEPLMNGTILGYINADEQEYVDALLKLDFIKDFGYWNNTDKPDDVTEQEWEEREKLWTEKLDRNYWFLEDGLTVGLNSQSERTFVIPDENLINDINNVSDSIIQRKIAQSIIMDKLIKNIQENFNSYDFMRVLFKVRDTLDETENYGVGPIPQFNIGDLTAQHIDFPIIDTIRINELCATVQERV